MNGYVGLLSATGTHDVAAARGKAGGLLIVNADDWGGFRAGTDAIETCFQAGAITSSTAMMYMSDSRRAAELAGERARPIGLHLNLTQPFDAPGVPDAVRERQRRLCLYFAPLARRRWIPSPFPSVHALVADAIRDQLEQFRTLYGREPTHLDSHHHVHVCPDVFASAALARGMRVRQTVSAQPRKRDPATLLRRFKHVLLASRFLTTDYFCPVRELAREGAGIPIRDAVRMASARSVEVMVHPSFPGESEVLCSQPWAQAIAGAPLGSYARLSP